jgi:anion-transporting  ArsA/GET3 family ATPase
VLAKVIGAQFLHDLSRFVASLETMFGGFRERADHTYRLLKDPGTAFLVVATPERDALREASYFVERLSADAMPLAGVVVNRTRRVAAVDNAEPLTAARAELAAESLTDDDDEARLARAALRVHAEVATAAEHDARMTRRFCSAHPEVPVSGVTALPSDVHDLDGLRTIALLLGA